MIACRTVDGFDGEHANVCNRGHVVAIFLHLFGISIGNADQLIGCLVQEPLGVHLVTDRAACTVGKRKRDLIFQRVGMLKAAKFAPGGVELTRHAQIFAAKQGSVLGGLGEVVVAPAARGQAFNLLVGVGGCKVASAAGNMPLVVENAHVRLNGACSSVYAFIVFLIRYACKTHVGVEILGIPALLDHLSAAVGAEASALADNVKENADGIVAAHDLFHLRDQRIVIRRVHAKQVIGRTVLGHVMHAVFLGNCGIFVLGCLQHAVIGVLVEIFFVKACGNVDGGLHTDLGTSFKHLSKQVKIQLRVNLVCL